MKKYLIFLFVFTAFVSQAQVSLNDRIHMTEAKSKLEQGEFSAALLLLEKLSPHAKSSPMYYSYSYQASLGLGDCEKAYHFSKGLLERTQNAQIFKSIAACYVKNDDFDKAIGVLTEAFEIFNSQELVDEIVRIKDKKVNGTCNGCTEEQKRVVKEFEANMVSIPAGSFRMGCSEGDNECYDDEKRTHQVSLSGFRISKYEVTQGQWEAVMGTNPSYFKGCEDCPVEQVSWDEAQEFIEELNSLTGKSYRLPTEAEWEYAARGGEQNTKYSGSDNIGAVAWYEGNSGRKTHPVGQQKQANGYGLYDMSGNVMEWCSDWYGDYSSNSQSNPQGPSTGANRVGRGGSWYYNARYCRVSYRDYDSPDDRGYHLGFRLAR